MKIGEVDRPSVPVSSCCQGLGSALDGGDIDLSSRRELMTQSTTMGPQGMEDCCPLGEPGLQVKYTCMSPRRRVLRILSKTFLILRSGKPKMIIGPDVFETVCKVCFGALVSFCNFENIAVRKLII